MRRALEPAGLVYQSRAFPPPHLRVSLPILGQVNFLRAGVAVALVLLYAGRVTAAGSLRGLS